VALDITFTGRRVFSGQGRPFEGHVKVCGKRIVSVGAGMPANPGRVVDVGDSRIIPGLIDLHIHGSAGNNAVTDNIEELVSMARFLADNGVTAFQPTSSAAPVPLLEKGIEVVRELTRGPVRGARSIGMHMEGPFLNPVRKGAMSKELLLPPDLSLLKRWLALGDGTINHVTVAPELPGALDLISYLVSHGVTASAGHTFATFAEMMEGFRAGVTVGNHTYNAMRELHHREPGALGTANNICSNYRWPGSMNRY
jgi:N-acetylglucosamine-6-phosphate deacetylase